MAEIDIFYRKGNHITLTDHRRRMFADVYFRNNHVYCELCEEEKLRTHQIRTKPIKGSKGFARKGLDNRRRKNHTKAILKAI